MLEVVLSGNGFLDPLSAPLLAAIVDSNVALPDQPGMASLRGSGVCALRALRASVPSLTLRKVIPLEGPQIRDRYRRYKILRVI